MRGERGEGAGCATPTDGPAAGECVCSNDSVDNWHSFVALEVEWFVVGGWQWVT